MSQSVFEALADPHRRRLLGLVAVRERSAGELAAEFGISRPAVSRHLRVLREAGLVSRRGDAQRRLYRLDPAPLNEITGWIEHTRDNWARRLDSLASHLDDLGNEDP
ncbi:ArsR/SmtB family transcription factor [Actinomadura sp. 9N407]|uniref:ArsR/SmtB family transcription factor n=1 Tax=Actinomadura sp. 9N407 TaxID=3375154 RepID=UPI0037AF9251